MDLFLKDPYPGKVNLSIGVYRTEEGKPHVYNSVRKAEEDLARFDGDKEYTSSVGNETLVDLSKQLVFGNNREILDRVQSEI